jgi:hypothetical protein
VLSAAKFSEESKDPTVKSSVSLQEKFNEDSWYVCTGWISAASSEIAWYIPLEVHKHVSLTFCWEVWIELQTQKRQRFFEIPWLDLGTMQNVHKKSCPYSSCHNSATVAYESIVVIVP